MLLTRIVTIYRQWAYLRLWIGDDILFADSTVTWFIYNDAPDDPCPPDLRERLADRRITLIERPFNAGRSEARNFCARATISRWLDFIDGDDIPLPIDLDWLSGVAPGRLLHFPHFTYSLVDGRIETANEPAYLSSFFWDIGMLRHLPALHTRPAGLIFPYDTFHTLGGFDGRFDTCEDLHLLWKFDRYGAEAEAGHAPKQNYRVLTGESCDPLVIGSHSHRLMRLAALHAPDAATADRIHTYADTQALRAIRSLYTELTTHYTASPARHSTTVRDVTLLFGRTLRIFLKEGPRPKHVLRKIFPFFFK